MKIIQNVDAQAVATARPVTAFFFLLLVQNVWLWSERKTSFGIAALKSLKHCYLMNLTLWVF